MKWKLIWNGDEVKDKVLEETVRPALIEFGLKAETASKRKLKVSMHDDEGNWIKWGGRGKQYGTLQRSIHIASPDYDWGGDVGSDDERGGVEAEPKRDGDKMTIQLGSGIEYAIYVHEIHYNPDVKHFIIRSVDEIRPEMPKILDKYALER